MFIVIQWFVEAAAAFEAAVLEILHKGKAERMHEGSQARKRQVQAVTEGREALGSALVRLRSNGRLYSGNGISPDIVNASIRAYLNALNKIVYEESVR